MLGVNTVIKSAPLFSVFLSMILTVFANAQQDVRGVMLHSEATRVIDEKCLGCHNRKLIDEAVKDRKQMNDVLKRMEKKGGGTLTRKERDVLGVYWGQKVFKTD
jgi:hypothetical protein